jgi:hypothetical protein
MSDGLQRTLVDTSSLPGSAVVQPASNPEANRQAGTTPRCTATVCRFVTKAGDRLGGTVRTQERVSRRARSR